MEVLDFIEQSGTGAGFVFKNTTGLYYFNGTSFLQAGVDAAFVATTGSGTNVMNISSVTSGIVGIGQVLSGGTLTPVVIQAFGTFDGTSGTVLLSSVQTWANPTNVTAATSFPAKTVKGIVYLDGTYYVMTPDGFIYGSEINDPTSWTALNVISAQSEPDGGVCLARQLNLIVAFGTYSTEFLYNAANPPPGSPLLPYSSAFLEIGCATAGSVINAENSLIFMSVGRQKGRSISLLEGTTPKTLSTPYIDRLLNADTLVNVTAYYIKVQGHGFYVLALPSTNLTLVYDFTSAKWSKWTQLLLNPIGVGATSMSWADGIVTATYPNHTFDDGGLVEIKTALPTGYNGQYVINVIDANTITYALATNPGTYVSGAEAFKYDEVAFNMASYTHSPSFDMVQDSTTGVVYSVSTGIYQDNDIPIRYSIRTENLDGGTNFTKFYSRLEVIGDKVEGTLYSRHTNDDYRTYSKYRPINLSNKRSQIYRLGSARRRAFEFVNYDNQPIRLNNMEFSVDKGYA